MSSLNWYLPLLQRHFFLSQNVKITKSSEYLSTYKYQQLVDIVLCTSVRSLNYWKFYILELARQARCRNLYVYSSSREEIKLLNYFWGYKVHSSILSENIEHFHVFNLDAIHSILIHWLCIGSWQQYYPDIKCKNQNKIFIICWVSAKRNPRWLGSDLSAIDWPAVPYGERTITDHFGKRD